MTQKRLIGTAFALVVLSVCSANARAHGDSAEVVIQWNQILNDTIPATAGFGAIRYYPGSPAAFKLSTRWRVHATRHT